MSRELRLRADAELAHPADRAWAVLADYGRDPEWRTGVVAMAPEPAGPVSTSTTTAEVLRLGGRTYRNDGRVTGVDPGRSFTWCTTRGADAHGARSVEPLGPDRCRVRLELVVRPSGAERVLAPLLGRMLSRNLDRDLRRLGALLGAAASPEVGRPPTGAAVG